MSKRLKVYGTIAGEKRFLRKGRYYTIKRDKRGRFKSMRKWTPKRPNVKARYVEKYTKKGTGKELHIEVGELIREDVWTEFKVESP